LICEITSRWWPTTENAAKQAKRKGHVKPYAASLTTEERAWAEALMTTIPEANLLPLSVEGSEARADIEGLQGMGRCP